MSIVLVHMLIEGDGGGFEGVILAASAVDSEVAWWWFWRKPWAASVVEQEVANR